MNDAMTSPALATSAVFLAVATGATVALVALVARGLREPGAHRTLWRAAMATILTLFVGESTGLFAAGGAWMRHQLAALRRPSIAATDVSPIALHRESAHIDAIPAPRNPTSSGEASRELIPVNVESVEAELSDTEYFVSVELAFEELSDPILPIESEVDEQRIDDDSSIQAPVAKGDFAAPAGPATPSEIIVSWRHVFGGVWGFVAAVLTLRLGAARFVWLWRYRHARPVGDREIKQCVGALARELGLRRRVAVWSSPRWVAPVAWGVWRPSVGLPEDFREAYSPAERDAMLAHELGHLAARDPAWQFLADSVVALLWWAPWCWWLRRQLRIAAEWMADEASLLVTDGPQALAECLVMLGRRMTPEASAAYAVTGSFRSNLGRRVERLLQLAETASVEGPSRPRFRWRMPALAACVALSLVAGSAWARSGIESTQGADQMRWFEQSWRRSLAGGIVSLALGAPTATVMGQEEGAEVEFEVEVAVDEESEDHDDDEEAEAAEEAEEQAADEAEEAAEDAEDAAEEAEDAAAEVAGEVEAAVEDVQVEVELALEGVDEEIAAALEEVNEELSGSLDEVTVEIDEALAEVEVELDSALAEADEAAVEVEAEIELVFEEGDQAADAEKDSDEAAEAKRRKAVAKTQEARAKAMRKAIEARHKALEKLQEKLGQSLKDREEKTRGMHEKMLKQRQQAGQQMEKARAKALEVLKKAQADGHPQADELEGRLEEQMREMERRLAEQEEMMRRRMREADEELDRARQEAEERLRDEQRHSEERIQSLLKGGRDTKQALQRLRLAQQQGDHDGTERQRRLDVLKRTISALREQGHEDAANQVAGALKLLAAQHDEEEVVVRAEKRRPQGEPGGKGELQGRVDQLQGEVNALRGEIAELRDLLKQALTEKKNGPPAP